MNKITAVVQTSRHGNSKKFGSQVATTQVIVIRDRPVDLEPNFRSLCCAWGAGGPFL